MSKTLLFLLAFIPASLVAQETKKVTEKDKSTGYTEVFYVLKSDKSVRHGAYQKLGFNDVVRTTGFYKYGIKDSTWIEYQRDGIQKKSEGNYADGNPVGVWSYYDYEGEVEQKYDYTKKELLYFKTDAKIWSGNCKIIEGTDTISASLERPPLFLGGSETMYATMQSFMKYPPEARENNIKGRVYISFIIDKTGKAYGHKVKSGIGYGCDDAAMKAVKAIPDNWLPALVNGKAVDVEVCMPMNFDLR